MSSKGLVAIIEYSRKGFFGSFHRRRDHNVPQEIIIKEMMTAGFQVYASFDFLPIQTFTIFNPHSVKKIRGQEETDRRKHQGSTK